MWKHLVTTFIIFGIINDCFSAQDESKEFKCTDGAVYTLNKCNMCHCAEGILHPCTLLNCEGELYYLSKYCTVGTKWKEDCNDCECVANHGTICTVKECPSTRSPDDDPIKSINEDNDPVYINDYNYDFDPKANSSKSSEESSENYSNV